MLVNKWLRLQSWTENREWINQCNSLEYNVSIKASGFALILLFRESWAKDPDSWTGCITLLKWFMINKVRFDAKVGSQSYAQVTRWFDVSTWANPSRQWSDSGRYTAPYTACRMLLQEAEAHVCTGNRTIAFSQQKTSQLYDPEIWNVDEHFFSTQSGADRRN